MEFIGNSYVTFLLHPHYKLVSYVNFLFIRTKTHSDTFGFGSVPFASKSYPVQFQIVFRLNSNDVPFEFK